jgi:hypothetical protein
MTLPMSPGPEAPTRPRSGHGGGDFGFAHAFGQVDLQHFHFGLFHIGQILAVGAFEGGDGILALLDQLVDDGDDGSIIELHALVHFLLLHRGLQQADGAQACAVLGTHGGFHVFGNLGLQAHRSLLVRADGA